MMNSTETGYQLAIGFDPGRDKCGIARVILPDGANPPQPPKTPMTELRIDQMSVVESSAAIAHVLRQCQEFPITTVVIGDGTSSKYWRQQLQAGLPETVTLVTVDEYNSTQEARDRYWVLYPPRGIACLIPAKLRSIPHPIDDIVAVILVERWFAIQSPKP